MQVETKDGISKITINPGDEFRVRDSNGVMVAWICFKSYDKVPFVYIPTECTVEAVE